MRTWLAIFLLVACGSSAQQGNQRKQINDPSEYNGYVNAIQQQSPAQKAQALEAFLQTYPNTVMKEDALEFLMVACQQANDAQKALDAATRVLQANSNNIRALALLTYNYRALASQGGPQMADNLARAKQYGQQGLQALQTMKKPDGMSDQDFIKLHNETGAIFNGAVAFAALQARDYITAQNDFKQAVEWESQPAIADIYPLATGDLEAKPMNPAGFWFIVKAANLAQGGSKQAILDYGRKKYIRYHGSEQGWNELVGDATSSAGVMPPFGFTVAAAPPPPPPSVQAAEIVQTKTPQEMSFAEWQLVLSSENPQAAQTVWNAIKGKTVRLAASVVSSSPNQFELAGSDDDIGTHTADILLKMATPMQSNEIPPIGKLMAFQGTIASYNPSPFTMIFTHGMSVPFHVAATSVAQNGSTMGNSGGTNYGSNSPGFEAQAMSQGASCNEVNNSVRGESRAEAGPGHCAGEVDAWLTNVSSQTIDCAIVFHRNGVWDGSSGLTVTLRPGEKLGGFLSPGGIWTCGADNGEVRYACFPHNQELASGCTARVQWAGGPPPSQGTAQHQPQSSQPAQQSNCNHAGCTTH